MESKMQDQMCSAEQEFDELIERLDPPPDWQQPDWSVEDNVHNWRNYASEDLQDEWLNMSGKQRMIIASLLNEAAGMEQWS